jgi:uncharacterized membrane protein
VINVPRKHDTQSEEDRSPVRLLAFSDGVYAVAITLLILSIQTPQLKDVPGNRLLDTLLQQWPSWLSYILSFSAVGIGWINHHEMFRNIKRTDVTLLALNLIILLFTTIFPVPTRLLAEYIRDADGLRVAAVAYGLVLVCISFGYFFVWYYAAKASLLDQQLAPRTIQHETRKQALEVLLAIVAVVIAFINAPLGITTYVLLALYYLITSYSRRLGKS